MSARLAVCLFNEGIQITSDIMGGSPLVKTSLKNADSSVTVYVKKASDSQPEWSNIVSSFSHIDISQVKTASSGAIVFIEVNNRLLGCCFGSTTPNINKENIVRDFGLAIAYHRISKENYKSIETHSLNENPLTQQKIIAKPGTQYLFNLDEYLETITELSGKQKDSVTNALIKGKEFFSLPSPLTLDDLKSLCNEILQEYYSVIKDDHFKRLTSLSKVKNKRLIQKLDESLCEMLDKRSTEVFLADNKHFENLDGYKLTPKGKKFNELEIDILYADVKKQQKFTPLFLKLRKIYPLSPDDQELDTWQLYNCICAQVRLNKGLHILYRGNWYKLQKRYLDDLKGFINRHEIDKSVIGLPAWDKIMTETAYNQTAAKQINAQCWDEQLYKHSNFPYGIEFCDILLSNYIIHVKKLRKSALTSHLQMQTYVSAQLLESDIDIRKWIKQKSMELFGKNILFNRSNNFLSPSVKYLIVLMGNRNGKTLADKLPFFGLITFNMIIRKISGLGFEVNICIV